MKTLLKRTFLNFKAKVKMQLAFIGLLLAMVSQVSANHYNYYNVMMAGGMSNIFPQKVIETTSKPTELYASISYGTSIGSGFIVPVLAKFDFVGNCTMVKSLYISTLPKADFYGMCIAECPNPVPPLNLGYAIGGDYFDHITGAFGHFVIMTDVNGNPIWEQHWPVGMNTIGTTKAVMFSHDPANLYHVILASMDVVGATPCPALYNLPTAGGAIQKADYPDPNTETVRDALEIISSPAAYRGYYTVIDRVVSGKNVPGHIFHPWGAWAASTAVAKTMYYTSLPGTYITYSTAAATKDELTNASTPTLYLVGNCTRTTMSATRPVLIKVNITGGFFNYTPVDVTTMPATETVTSSGITLENYTSASGAGPRNLLISTTHTAPGLPHNAAFFAMDINFTAVGRQIYLYAPPGPLTINAMANCVCPTNNINNYTAIGYGPGTSYITESRLNWDGSLTPSLPACYNNKTITTAVVGLDIIPHTSGISATIPGLSSSVNMQLIVPPYNTMCGIKPPLGGIIPGPPYNYGILNSFNTADRLSTAYDMNLDQAIFGTTENLGSGNTSFLGSILYNGAPNNMLNYPNGGQDQTRAVAYCANGNIITGTKFTESNSNVVLKVTRTDAIGTQIWSVYFDQSTAALADNIYVTELANGDIVAACSAAGTDDIIIAHLAFDGSTISYRDFHLYNGGNPGENLTYVGGLAANPAGGYYVDGATGNNGDYTAGFLMSFDNTDALSWTSDFRKLLPRYDLSQPGERSNSYFNGISVDASGTIWCSGYVSDNDASGGNATYSSGLIATFNASGTLISSSSYADNTSGLFVVFNGINASGTNVLVTGYNVDPATGNKTTLGGSVNPVGYGLNWMNTYGSGIGSNIFITSVGNFLIAGVSGGQPNFISTDVSGATGCETAYALDEATETNDPVSTTFSDPTSATSSPESLVTYSEFDDLNPLCNPSPLGITAAKSKIADNQLITGLKYYPNPAYNEMNIDISALKNANGTISIIDVNGKEILNRKISISEGSNHYEIGLDGLLPGIYILKVVDDKNEAYPISKIQKY